MEDSSDAGGYQDTPLEDRRWLVSDRYLLGMGALLRGGYGV